jgi:CheY-like chemotaxis protein
MIMMISLLRETFQSLRVPNELVFFNRCRGALNYLKSALARPFLILCDVNLPEMIGTELKKIMFQDPELRIKGIPFIFFSTSSHPTTISEAFHWMPQGYFVKPLTHLELKMMMRCIVDYWMMSRHP